MRLTVPHVGRLQATLIAALLLGVLAGGCGSQDAPVANTPTDGSAEADPVVLRVVATTNIIADWVENVGGERVEVWSIVPAGADPHGYVPRPAGVTAIAAADLVLSVGLGLEAEWLGELMRNAASDESKIVALGEMVGPIESSDEDVYDDEARRPLDPHFWFDPLRVQQAISDVTSRLSGLDPEGGDFYEANAAKYNKQLDDLHASTLEKVSTIPPERRLLVTSHDSLRYFASVYGFEIVGTVFPSSATEVEPSAEEMGNLVEAVDEHGVAAIFGETTVTERLAAAIANETGAKLVRLYSGSLGGPDSGAESYIAMMRTDVERIVEALQ